MTSDYLTPPSRKIENNIQVSLFARIEDFSLEEANHIYENFMSQIPQTNKIQYSIGNNCYKEEPIDNPYFVAECNYTPETIKEAFTLFFKLNSLEIKSICNSFKVTLNNKNYIE